MAFDPPIWKPLFNFLRNELFPLLGGGGGDTLGNRYLDLFHDNSDFYGGLSGKSLLDVHPYGFTMYQTPDEAYWTHDALLETPTLGYVVGLLCVKTPNGGLMDLYVNDVWQQQFDFYADPEEINTLYEITIGASEFPTTGLYTFKGVTNGKNVSSGGYECPITKIQIRPYFA